VPAEEGLIASVFKGYAGRIHCQQTSAALCAFLLVVEQRLMPFHQIRAKR